jgi:NhaC family Na+:H+ antiporter
MIATLDLEPWTYVPFCLVNLLSPAFSLLYGFTGWTIRRLPEPEKR